MQKVQSISGFPEWLPEQKLVEDRVIATIKTIYQRHGFTPLETPAVEWLSTLGQKGEITKEIYVLKRLRAEEGAEADLALHFDLTVPFARYVAQHFGALQFPFRRYQLQKVWRGERPQKGRMREFYQFDIDIVAQDELPLSCDAEILTTASTVFSALPLGPFVIRVNNRKILLGLYESLGLSREIQDQARITVDKIDKIGRDGVFSELTKTLGIEVEKAQRILAFSEVRVPAADAGRALASLGVANQLFEEGCRELLTVLSYIPENRRTCIQLDCSIARGLDYYTGVIFELRLIDHVEYGTVFGGGRYEDLASEFTNKKLPGVGGSIGLSRLMSLIFDKNLIACTDKSPSQVLIAVFSEDQRLACNCAAATVRDGGVPTEVYFKSPKLGKQIDYAAKRGIRYIVFIDPQSGQAEVKDLQAQTQEKIPDLASWARSVAATV